MSCHNCHGDACAVAAAEQAESIAYHHLACHGGVAFGDAWRSASEALATAQADCDANCVDWRARALTAEAALAAVRATADRLADFFDRQPSDYRLGLRHGAQRAVEAAAEAKP